MPRSLDPNSRLTMVLSCDIDKVPQPRIFARTLTLNQQRKLMASLGKMGSDDSISKMDAALDAAEICLTGWENMINPDNGSSIVFSRETIGDVLSIDELGEVFQFVTSAGIPTVADKKKSE